MQLSVMPKPLKPLVKANVAPFEGRSEEVCPFQRIRSGMPHILRQSLEYLRSEVGFAWSANVVFRTENPVLQTRQSLASSDFR